MKRFSLFLIAIVCCTMSQAQRQPKQVYIPMDYSTCGYHASETDIPNVPIGIYVSPISGDNSSRIQQAIDYLAAKKPDVNGSRGAVLLGEGVFYIDTPLRVTTSGIVIRGMGRGKTTIIKRGVDRGALIYFEGGRKYNMGDAVDITDQKIKAGSCSFTVASAGQLQVGDRVQITRPSTAEWIQSLKMSDFGGGLNNGWKPTDIDITWDRTVVAVEGSKVTVDAPLTTTISQEFGGAYLSKGYNEDEITECGVENLSLASEVNNWNKKDEDHCWDAIWMENVRDAWVRMVTFERFAGSAVNLQKHTSRITVEDCISKNPVSELGGWRRNVFTTRGQQCLFQRCASYEGMHDFTAGTCAAGPNAFVQCDAIGAHHFSGSIGSWAAGLLFDIVNIEGHDLHLGNLETYNTGMGWNTANSLLWQCTASTLWCYSPDEDNRCSAHGAWGTFSGNGEWTSSNAFVNPFSLFYDQLQKRTGREVDGRILRHEGIVTTSPTVEQAMEMAQVSLTQPRVTMEMWIDKVPFTASLSSDGVPTVDQLKKAKPAAAPAQKKLAIKNGIITLDNKIITGNQYDIPWWSGSVKDNFTRRGARPAITRFVPGREGTGWTDRIDSVVTHLKNFGFTALYHHYGLWYDLRRTDHERVRRADGEVCP
ncbi:MAG: pectate lyase, partial [Prevotella sp.]|nr:pectate lyase [Prevotella sp.]